MEPIVINKTIQVDRKHIILYSVCLVAVIAVIILIVGLVGSKKGTADKELYTQAMKAQQQVIDVLKEEVVTLKIIKDEYRNDAKEHLRNDSLTEASQIIHQVKYQPLNKRYEDIPINISRIANDDDSIRAAFDRY